MNEGTKYAAATEETTEVAATLVIAADAVAADLTTLEETTAAR